MKKAPILLTVIFAFALPFLVLPGLLFSPATAFNGRDSLFNRPGPREKIVALSFDDGPDPRYTLPILKTLEENGARATFFVVGSEAEKNPDIVRDIDRQGHEVANHTWTHPDMAGVSVSQVMAEVHATNLLINRLTGKQNNYFRPPRGVLTPEAEVELTRAGYKIIMWDIGIENSKMKTPGEMAERVLKSTRPGEIILLHDGRLDRSKTVEALPILLEGLREKGYRATTVSEVLTKATAEKRP